MKTEAIFDNDIEVDEYDDFQYEMTSEMAHNFIQEALIPLLEEFDFNNPNEDYIPGVATYELFMKIVSRMLEEGFTQEQLKDAIDEYNVYCIDDIIH
jgi:hypothetical protein